METFDDLKSKLDLILATLPQILAAEQAQAQRITDLQNQLAAGVPVTQAQLDELGTEADTIVSGVQALVPPAPPTP